MKKRLEQISTNILLPTSASNDATFTHNSSLSLIANWRKNADTPSSLKAICGNLLADFCKINKNVLPKLSVGDVTNLTGAKVFGRASSRTKSNTPTSILSCCYEIALDNDDDGDDDDDDDGR